MGCTTTSYMYKFYVLVVFTSYVYYLHVLVVFTGY